MAAIPGTVIGDKIVPSDSNDNYPTHAASLGLGGHRTVQDLTERNAILSSRLEEGMLVYVIDEQTTYQLLPGFSTPTINADWEPLNFTGGSGTPSGPTNSLQFNDNGSFEGDGDLSWNNTTKELAINGDLTQVGKLNVSFVSVDTNFEVGYSYSYSVLNTANSSNINGGNNFVYSVDGNFNLSRLVGNTNNVLNNGSGSVSQLAAFTGQVAQVGPGTTVKGSGLEVGGNRFGGTFLKFVGVIFRGAPTFEPTENESFEFGPSFVEGNATKILDDTTSKHISFKYTSAMQVLAASDTVDVDGSDLRVMGNGSAITLTSTPSLQAGSFEGQEITIVGQSDSLSVTLQDESALPGSTIILQNGTSRALGENQNISLFWNGSAWVEKAPTTGLGRKLSNRTLVASASYNALDSDELIAVNFAGAVTVNLPTAVGRENTVFVVVDESGSASANPITIEPDGSETISGGSNFVLGSYEALEFYSNGSNWFIK